MQTWNLSFGANGSRLEVHKVPGWAWTIEQVTEWADAKIFRHCLCGPPAWTFHIPLSLKWDEDFEMWDRSLGSVVMRTFNKLLSVTDKRRQETHSIPITDEWLKANDLWESWMDAWMDDEEEEDAV